MFFGSVWSVLTKLDVAKTRRFRMLVIKVKEHGKVVLATPEGRIISTIVVVEFGDSRLGFEAPQGVKIYRWELWERLCWGKGWDPKEGNVA